MKITPENPISIKGMFGGLRPSRGAQKIVQEAIGLKQDPTLIVQRAVEVARDEGKTRVGRFGKAGAVFRQLEEINYSERIKNMTSKFDRRA